MSPKEASIAAPVMQLAILSASFSLTAGLPRLLQLAWHWFATRIRKFVTPAGFDPCPGFGASKRPRRLAHPLHLWRALDVRDTPPAAAASPAWSAQP